jgi:hypothetical protein
MLLLLLVLALLFFCWAFTAVFLSGYAWMEIFHILSSYKEKSIQGVLYMNIPKYIHPLGIGS